MTMPGRTDDAGMNGNEFVDAVVAVTRKAGNAPNGHVEHALDDALDIFDDTAMSDARGLESPTGRTLRAGRTLSPTRLKCLASGFVISEQRNPVQRRASTAIATEHDRESPTNRPDGEAVLDAGR